ncbi:translation initiation factor IF-2-like [Lontra canadensis]|uniref:translation initiation factor IF-2-like n=1 Tax=Lontra canadensis TaxID=76717 RepID=UPI0013F2BF98|nr:translation initiation factor IF-2-like [Lontra canadensis]
MCPAAPSFPPAGPRACSPRAVLPGFRGGAASGPSLPPPLPGGPLPGGPLPRSLPARSRSLPAHSRGDVPRRGPAAAASFYTLVGSCAPRSVTGELAARRRLPHARTPAGLRGSRRLLGAAGRRGTPGLTVGRRRKRRGGRKRKGEDERGGGREACHLQPPRERPRCPRPDRLSRKVDFLCV